MEVISYYLGQFHPVEANSRFWGDGFTEWHNVAKARPLYPGHEQPVLPGKLGFYDLRCDDSLLDQQDLAREYGITTFCHWHYWFSGKRVLHGPLDRMLQLPHRGIKMMLGWANESWTGVWHGLSDQVIFEQEYGREELHEHAKLIASYIKSDRYLKINGASPFLIYKPRLIPNAVDYLDELRECVRKHGGGDLYIIGTWGPGRSQRIDKPGEFGLDALVANNVGRHFESPVQQSAYLVFWNLAKRMGLGPEVRRYSDTVDTMRAAFNEVSGIVHATVVTGWDNTPRSGRRGLVLRKYNESTFKDAVREALLLEHSNVNRLLFIKSWNEWAEGNVMEPAFKERWSCGKALKEVLDGLQ